MFNFSTRYLILFTLIVSFFVGCGDAPKNNEGGAAPVVVSDTSKQIEKVLEDATSDDCLTLYFIFSGIANYTEKYESGIKNTSQINELYRIVKERLGKGDGWLDKDGPNNDPSDVIEARLTSFVKPEDFSEDSRIEFVKAYREFEIGALNAWKTKD